MNHKILLIEPPFYRLHKNSYSLDRVPFGLAYLAGSILENTNWDVKVYNADFISSIRCPINGSFSNENVKSSITGGFCGIGW